MTESTQPLATAAAVKIAGQRTAPVVEDVEERQPAPSPAEVVARVNAGHVPFS